MGDGVSIHFPIFIEECPAVDEFGVKIEVPSSASGGKGPAFHRVSLIKCRLPTF